MIYTYLWFDPPHRDSGFVKHVADYDFGNTICFNLRAIDNQYTDEQTKSAMQNFVHRVLI